ncbi:phosphoribosyltransferase domain-containing protein [Candidatus Soleaferrea massiliensis]|uniref:phosphoribosyltransferase domain-containing protein n=1 Tax=Candidatus Soleaferrea massiliensis TaxID=1470354 RepID=UPI00058EA791|nr:phosphoribosyltransferase domain-containing protein [Candidatus Soleaferrea massiliensis]
MNQPVKRVYRVADALELTLELERTRFGLRPDALFGVSIRENPNRPFLFVSRVLGKHLPVAPKRMLSAAKLLSCAGNDAAHDEAELSFFADIVNGDSEADFETVYARLMHSRNILTKERRTLFIGFAETATGLAQSVFDSFGGDCAYVNTTRVEADDDSFLDFLEEHSHAKQHYLYLGRLSSFMQGLRRIALIDDELTTGNTMRNLIRALHRQFGVTSYTIYTLLDWRGDEHLEQFRQLEQELRIQIEVLSLIRGRIRQVSYTMPTQPKNLADYRGKGQGIELDSEDKKAVANNCETDKECLNRSASLREPLEKIDGGAHKTENEAPHATACNCELDRDILNSSAILREPFENGNGEAHKMRDEASHTVFCGKSGEMYGTIYRIDCRDLFKDFAGEGQESFSVQGRFGLTAAERDALADRCRKAALRLKDYQMTLQLGENQAGIPANDRPDAISGRIPNKTAEDEKPAHGQTHSRTAYIGTGEFIFLPMLLAAFLDENSRCQSTTQSPVMPYPNAGSAIECGVRYHAPDCYSAAGYLYNVVPGQYERAFLFVEAGHTCETGLKELCVYLKDGGIDQIFMIYL